MKLIHSPKCLAFLPQSLINGHQSPRQISRTRRKRVCQQAGSERTCVTTECECCAPLLPPPLLQSSFPFTYDAAAAATAAAELSLGRRRRRQRKSATDFMFCNGNEERSGGAEKRETYYYWQTMTDGGGRHAGNAGMTVCFCRCHGGFELQLGR